MPEWFTDPRCEKDSRGLMAKHWPHCQCGWRPALHVTDDGPPAGFEQQVAAALWFAAVDARVGAPEIVTRLAPRVAAAIDAAVYEFARSAGDPTNDSATWQQAALEILRAGA